MKIGIWGSYDKGNFGDDLMAFMISSYLKKNGYEVILFNATKKLQIECDCDSLDDYDSFAKNCEKVVVGGGGMLINNSILKLALKPDEFKFDYAFLKLYKALKKYNTKLIPISIGGSGNATITNPFKRKLFSSPTSIGGTVRLPADLNCLDNSLFTHYQDIVLTTSDFYEVIRTAASKNRIILNLKNKSSKTLIDAIDASGLKNKYDIWVFGSHLADSANFAGYEYKTTNNYYQYSNLKEAVQFLADARCIISSKLHVGVTGLSFGTNFISYKGPGKAKEFLDGVNLADYIIDEPYDVINKIEILPDLQDLSNFKNDAKQHYVKLLELLAL